VDEEAILNGYYNSRPVSTTKTKHFPHCPKLNSNSNSNSSSADDILCECDFPDPELNTYLLPESEVQMRTEQFDTPKSFCNNKRSRKLFNNRKSTSFLGENSEGSDQNNIHANVHGDKDSDENSDESDINDEENSNENERSSRPRKGGRKKSRRTAQITGSMPYLASSKSSLYESIRAGVERAAQQQNPSANTNNSENARSNVENTASNQIFESSEIFPLEPEEDLSTANTYEYYSDYDYEDYE